MEFSKDMWVLVVAEAILLIAVLIILPWIGLRWVKGDGKAVSLKGLALPQGSVRSMLALMIVGSYMIIIVIGSGVEDENFRGNFTEILSALSGITGAVVGFYFGSQGSGGGGASEEGRHLKV